MEQLLVDLMRFTIEQSRLRQISILLRRNFDAHNVLDVRNAIVQRKGSQVMVLLNQPILFKKKPRKQHHSFINLLFSFDSRTNVLSYGMSMVVVDQRVVYLTKTLEVDPENIHVETLRNTLLRDMRTRMRDFNKSGVGQFFKAFSRF